MSECIEHLKAKLLCIDEAIENLNDQISMLRNEYYGTKKRIMEICPHSEIVVCEHYIGTNYISNKRRCVDCNAYFS